MKKLLSTVVAAAAVLTLGVTSQAKTPEQQAPQQAPKTQQQPAKETKEQAAPQSQMQSKQDYEAKYKEAQAKFDALSDKQKKELYDLYDKINVQKLKLLDKYVEFGLVTKEEADIIRTEMAAHAKDMRESNKLVPHVGMVKHKHHDNKQTASDKEVEPKSDESGAETEEKKAE